MKTVGFPISHKENEYRRAIVPAHLKNIERPELLYFEKAMVRFWVLRTQNMKRVVVILFHIMKSY